MYTPLKKTAFVLGTGCLFGLLSLAHPALAEKQATFTAPGESNPTAFAKSKPGKMDGVPVKPKTTTSKSALNALKNKVKNDKSITATKLTEQVSYGESVQDWSANTGDTVQSLLMNWSEESGWTLVWKLDRDYILEAGVVFRGTYMDAAMALLRSFARANPAPIGTFYKGNRVLVVSTREDENEG